MASACSVFDEQDGWAWVQLERDGYVGYIPATALSDVIVAPTHRVKAIGTFLYPRTGHEVRADPAP